VTRVHLIHPAELGASEIARWHRLQEAEPALAHPFLSAEYAMAAGRFRPQSRVAVLVDGPRTVGFFPFEVRKFGLGVPISGWLSAYQGAIQLGGTQCDPGELLRGCGLSAWQFDNVIADQEPFSRYAVTCHTPVMDLAAGFDAYERGLRERAPRFCRELGRKARKLGREHGSLRMEFDTRDAALLSRLIAWKSAQYQTTNHVDRFQLPWVTGLLHELLDARSDHLTGLLSVLYAGDEPVSIQFGLRAGRVVAGWFSGYDHRFGKYSPGLIQVMMMAEALGRHGVETLHMGKGAKDSVRAFKNGDITVGEGTVTAHSVLGLSHRVLGGVGRQALRTVRRHPGLHRAADRVLRRSGVSGRLYGKV
jgi:CelD/BcsL family acetyltransferase involved in cellulose biosynthesis